MSLRLREEGSVVVVAVVVVFERNHIERCGGGSFPSSSPSLPSSYLKPAPSRPRRAGRSPSASLPEGRGGWTPAAEGRRTKAIPEEEAGSTLFQRQSRAGATTTTTPSVHWSRCSSPREEGSRCCSSSSSWKKGAPCRRRSGSECRRRSKGKRGRKRCAREKRARAFFYIRFCFLDVSVF